MKISKKVFASHFNNMVHLTLQQAIEIGKGLVTSHLADSGTRGQNGSPAVAKTQCHNFLLLCVEWKSTSICE